jgi:alanine racemase
MDNHNGSSHLTQVIIHLDRLSHNMRLLQQQVGDRPLWPAIKANAYGHGAEIVARHLVGLGYDTLCVAHVFEADALLEAGIEATFIILSATLPEHAEAIVAHGCEPAICTMDMAEGKGWTLHPGPSQGRYRHGQDRHSAR